jgi:cysteinyl-tRNA synthetase
MVDVLGLPLQAADGTADLLGASPFIDLLVEMRSALRAERQWALADLVRNRLKELGIALEDTPQGTVWRRDQGA